MLAVDDDPASRATIDGELRKRYGGDHDVVTEAGPEPALQRVGQLNEAGRALALALVDHCMSPITGIELLARIHAVYPTAKRALLGTVGDRSVMQPVIRLPPSARSTPTSRSRCTRPTSIFTGRSPNCWRSGAGLRLPRSSPSASSVSGGRLAATSSATFSAATASRTSSAMSTPRRPGRR